MTSNLPFSGWAGVFGDQAVAAAMIDRIVHHADVLTLKSQLPAPRPRHRQPCQHPHHHRRYRELGCP
jgi:DNA replication protein DnaC